MKRFLAAVFVCLACQQAPARAEDHRSNALQDLPVRVQVQAEDQMASLRVSTTSSVSVLTALGWKEVGHLLPTYTLKVEAAAQGLKVSSIPGHEFYQALKLEVPNGDAMVQSDQGWYRGNLVLWPNSAHGFSVVNEVSMEQYLYSVVPSEMPASWPMEALKSQAVAARTFALSHLEQDPKRRYDLTATTASQVYQGVKAEHPNSIRAVEATRGEIMTYQGRPILAYFHSTSGGRTENGADLWANQPYLKSVPDVDQASPKYTWHEQLSQEEVQKRLQQGLNLDLGNVISLEPKTYTGSGRVKTLSVLGTRGQREVDALKFRSALQLNSTFFNVGAISSLGELIRKPDLQEIPTAFQFAGRGWGHGLGMSQWGARQMALDGYAYHEILAHYYQGVHFEKFNPSRYRLARTF